MNETRSGEGERYLCRRGDEFNLSIGTLGEGVEKVNLELRPLTLAFNNYQYVHRVMSCMDLTVDKKPIRTSVGAHPLGQPMAECSAGCA